MRGLVYAGIALVGVAALVGRHPAGVPRPAVDRARPSDNFEDLAALRHLHAAAAARRPDRDDDGPLAVRTFDGRATPAERHAVVPLRLLRARHDPRRHARRGARSRSPTSGCRARCSRRRRSCTSPTAACSCAPRCDRLVAAEVDRPHHADDAGDGPRPARRRWPRCSPRCRTTSPGSPTSRRASGTYDYSGPPACGTSLVTIGHVLMVARRRRPSLGLAAAPDARDDAAVGDDPWDGPDAGVADDVAGPDRQLRRGADRHVARAGARPPRSLTEPNDDARPAGRPGPAAAPPGLRRHRARRRRHADARRRHARPSGSCSASGPSTPASTWVPKGSRSPTSRPT